MKKILILLLGVLLAIYGNAQQARTRGNAPLGTRPANTQRLPADSFTWSGYQPVAGICPGGNLVIHATHYPLGSTFQWLINGSPIAGATTDSLQVNSVADYTVEVTQGGNTYTWPTLTPVIHAAPTPSFTSSPDNICSSTPITFANSTPGTNTYLWNFNDPVAGVDSISTAVNPTHFFVGDPRGGNQTFNVSLTATNSFGCPTTVTGNVHTQSPSTNLGGSGLTTFNGRPVFTSCVSTGATLTFVNNSTTQGTNTDYEIIWGDNTANYGPGTTFTNVNHFYAPGSYTLGFVVGGPGCRDTGYYGVYIGTNPAVGLSNPGNTVTCSENSLTFPITSTSSNSPGTTYTVSFNDGTSAQVFNHPAPPNVTHTFLMSSCGTTSVSGSTQYPNSFSATIRATNPCGSSSASIVPIYVSKKPNPIMNVGPNDTVCTNMPVIVSNASGNMQSVSNGVCTPGKVVWKIFPATGYTVTGSLGDDLNSTDPGVWVGGANTLNFVFTTPGTYTVRMMVGNTSLCATAFIDQIICVNGQPTADFTLSAASGCAPFNVTSANASVPANCNPNRYDWTVTYANPANCGVNAANWTFANGSTTNSTNPEFTFTNPGVYTVQLVTTPPGNTCFATSTQTVTVKTKPVIDWQPLAPICQGQFSPVAAVNDCYSTAPSTYVWTFNGGTPAAASGSSPVTSYPNTGTFTIGLDVTNECGTSSQTQTLTVNPTPSVNQPANQVVCNTSTAPATNFSSPLPGITFNWTNSDPSIGLPASGVGDVPAFTALNSTGSPIVATITVTPSSTTCDGPPKTYTITVNPTPPINAGPDQIICNASSVTMQAVLAPGTTGVWNQIPTSNTTIVTPTSPTTTINGLVPNATYQFRWTVTGSGICSTVSDTVTILNRPLPSPATAGPDTLICDFVGGIFSTFNLQGNTPVHPWELGTWTVVGGSNTLNAAPTIADPNLGTSVISGVGLGAGPLQGSITLQWSITNDGGCPATSDQMTITVVRRPTAGTLGPVNPICYNTGTTITATGYEGSILKWRRQDAPLATNPFVDVPGNTTPNITLNNLTGDVALQFIVTPVNPLCPKNDTASVVLPVDPAIVNSINGRIDSVCSGVVYTTGNFPATGGNGGVPQYQWMISNDGITFTDLATFTLSDYTFTPDHTVWLMRRVTIGTCTVLSRDTIKVWVEPPVTNNTITGPQTICANTPPAPLAGSVPTAFGGAIALTYQWESSSNGVNFVPIPGATGQNYTPGVLNQNTWYRRIVRSNRCPTPTGGISDTVLISVTPAPAASFVPSSVLGCSPMTVTFTNNTVGAGNTYTWDFGDGSLPQTTTSNAPLQHVFTTGVLRNFTVSLTATNVCGTSTQNIVLTVQPNSVDLHLTVAGNQLSGCAPDTVKFYNSSPGGNQFTWNFQDGSLPVATTAPIDSIVHIFTTPGSYDVTLRGQNSCSDTTGHILITVYGSPVAAFNPNTLQVCIGAPITFNNTSTGATSYLWKFGDGQTSPAASPQHGYATPGTYTVWLIAYNTNAGGLVTCVDSVSTNVQVVASQTGSMTVSGTTSTCAPFTATFTNNTTPNTSVLWDFNDGTPTSSLNSVTHTFTLAGTYTVTLTVRTAAGCTYVTTQNITVNGPSGTLQYTGGFKCDGQSTHFAVIGNGATTYTWDMGDGSTPVTNSSPTFDYVYSTPGTFTPKVTLNAGSCAYLITGGTTVKMDRLRAGFSSQTVQSCGSTAVTFTDTSSAFFGIASSQWTFSNGNVVNNAPTTTQTFTNSNTLHATISITSNSGCVRTQALDIPVAVWNKPIVTLVPPAGNQGCARQPVTFDAVINSVDAIANVDWITSNNITGSGHPFLPVFGTPGTYTASLTVSTINGCSVNLTSPNITINPTPTVAIVDPAPICRGGSANLQANATGASTLQWSPTAGLSCTTCPNPVATPLFTTPYIVTATNPFGCSASDTATVTVTQPITMTVMPTSDSICIGDSIQLLATGATNYSWTTQANAVLSCTTCANPVFRPLAPGIYTATVVGANSCFTQTLPITIGVGGIPQINLGPDLVLATGTVRPLQSTITNGPIVSWLWSPATDLSCSTCPTPSVTVRQNRTYVVEGTTIFGCTNTDTLTIRTVCESLQTYVPNAFSPDGDGINDVLMVRGTGIAQVKSFRVFNRWGETVFERANFAPNDPAFGWDGKVKGKLSEPEVFVYTAEVVCENGITYSYKGNVSLLK